MAGEGSRKYYFPGLDQSGRAGAARTPLMDDSGPCGFRQHLGAASSYLRPDLYLLQVSQPPGARMSSEASLAVYKLFSSGKERKNKKAHSEVVVRSCMHGQHQSSSQAGEPLGAP